MEVGLIANGDADPQIGSGMMQILVLIVVASASAVPQNDAKSAIMFPP